MGVRQTISNAVKVRVEHSRDDHQTAWTTLVLETAMRFAILLPSNW